MANIGKHTEKTGVWWTMTKLIRSFHRAISDGSSAISLRPNTDYSRNVPKDATQLMKGNWENTGRALAKAINKVGKEIEKQ